MVSYIVALVSLSSPPSKLTYKQDEVRIVDRDQLRQGPHERLVVLHPSRGVDQHDVDARIAGIIDGLQGDT